MKRLFLIVWLLWSCGFLCAITPPQLRCLAVLSSGGVQLSWLAPTEVADFDHYEIFYAPDANSPFTSIGQLADVNQTTFVHTNAQALQNAQCRYFVQACSPNDCRSSDTLTTIEFYLSNSNNTLAILNWAAPIEPLLPTYSLDYEIFREYPADDWTPLATSQEVLYRDMVDVCSSNLGYRVELADASGCRNISRPLSDHFTDLNAPEMPQLDSVSVDFTTRKIHLGWEPATDPDVVAYIIYFQDGGRWISVDTVMGRYTTFWIDEENRTAREHSYRIAALDSCMNTSPMTDLQSSFHLSGDYDVCLREVTLTWTPYVNMPLGVEKYQILYSDDGAPLRLAGETNTMEYVLTGLIPQHNYQFVVRAVNYSGTITALSSKHYFTFDAPEYQEEIYISYVTVVDDEKLEIKVYTAETERFACVNLYRSDRADGDYQLFGTHLNNGTNSYLFADSRLDVDRDCYYYKATLFNECWVEVATSNVSHNIVLRAEADVADRIHHLQWSEYEGWAGPVVGYDVWRQIEQSDMPDRVSLAQSGSTFDDRVADLYRASGRFAYFVEAQEGVNPYNLAERSRSNTIELEQKPQTFIPNAFAPWREGPNAVFLPVHSFVSAENYHMHIYSREGMLLFHTQDPQTGWSGIYNGKLLPSGVYVYKIVYTYHELEYEYVGTVTLVR